MSIWSFIRARIPGQATEVQFECRECGRGFKTKVLKKDLERVSKMPVGPDCKCGGAQYSQPYNAIIAYWDKQKSDYAEKVKQEFRKPSRVSGFGGGDGWTDSSPCELVQFVPNQKRLCIVAIGPHKYLARWTGEIWERANRDNYWQDMWIQQNAPPWDGSTDDLCERGEYIRRP